MINKTSLFLVDLAGSEKLRKNTSENNFRIEEYKKINYSLFVLEHCLFNSNNENNNYNCNDLVTYKNSKLTRILQDCLKGNNKTSIIVTISPSRINLTETLSALAFAGNAMKIKIKQNVNLKKEINYKFLYEKLQEDLDSLNDDYGRLKRLYDEIDSENKNNKEKVFELEKKNSILEILNDKNNKNAQHYIFDRELKIVEELYEGKLSDLENENNILLSEMDKILIDKEQRLELITIENKNMKMEIEKYKFLLEELKSEKDDLMNNVINNLGKQIKNEDEENEINNGENFNNRMDEEIQTESEIAEHQILELFKNIEMSLETVNLNFNEQNIFYKLEYFISLYEKEMTRIKKENKELKDKLKRNKEMQIVKNIDLNYTGNSFNYFEDNFNANIIASPKLFCNDQNNLKHAKTLMFILDNSNNPKEDSFGNNLSDKFLLSPQKIYSFHYPRTENKNYSMKDLSIIKQEFNLEIDSLNKEHIFIPKTTQLQEDTEDKIVELQTEILKLKTVILKKNKKLEQFLQIITDKDKNNFPNFQTEKNNYPTSNEILKINETYSTYLEQIKLKYRNKNKFLEDIKIFFDNTSKITQKIENFFDIITNENKKHYLSDLFEKDLDFYNLDIYNFNIFIHKINNLIYIIKLEEQLNFHEFFYLKISKNQTDNVMSSSFNNLIKNLLALFEIMIKTLITENSKLFYYSTNMNKLIRMNIEQKYDLMILQKKYEMQKELLKSPSLKSNGNNNGNSFIGNGSEEISTLSITENAEEVILLQIKEKENFTKAFEKIINGIEYKIISINNKNMFGKLEHK